MGKLAVILHADIVSSTALVQLNDPDPWLWTGFYLVACALCGLYAVNKLGWQAPAILAVLALGGSLWLLPQFLGQVDSAEIFESMTMQTRAVEEAREAGGALLVGLWMAALGWQLRLPRQNATQD